jgi:hypothetical protein
MWIEQSRNTGIHTIGLRIMADDRPLIPEPIRREVRQRCGFGCVVCGLPLYEYDHLIPYSVAKKHEAHNLTLLCPTHLAEKRKTLLTQEQIARANANPFAVKNGVASPFGLHFEGKQIEVVIGGNEFTGGITLPDASLIQIPISIDDIDLVAFRVDGAGNVFLYACFFDRYNMPILTIFENCIVFSAIAGDIKFAGTRLTIREPEGDVLLEIEFVPPNRALITQGHVLCNGVELLIRNTYLFVVNSDEILNRSRFHGDFHVGMQMGRNTRGYKPALVVEPKSLSRYYLSKGDIMKRERDAVKKYRELHKK